MTKSDVFQLVGYFLICWLLCWLFEKLIFPDCNKVRKIMKKLDDLDKKVNGNESPDNPENE